MGHGGAAGAVGGAPPRVPAVRAMWVARVRDIRIICSSSFRYVTILGKVGLVMRGVLEAAFPKSLRESWIRGCPDGRTMTFGRTPGL